MKQEIVPTTEERECQVLKKGPFKKRGHSITVTKHPGTAIRPNFHKASLSPRQLYQEVSE
jgi:hypothetical protein